VLEIQGGEERVLRVRLTMAKDASDKPFGPEFEKIFQSRKDDADEFYNGVLSGRISTLLPVPCLYALNPLSSIYIFTYLERELCYSLEWAFLLQPRTQARFSWEKYFS
jgi:hypothetical protein